MRNLFFSIVFISLCSCGRSSGQKIPGDAVTNSLNTTSENSFALPQLNTHKTVTTDQNVSPQFENLSFAQTNEKNILGDKPFYININQIWDSRDYEMQVAFYSRTKVKGIFYFEAKNSLLPLVDIRKENIPTLKLKDVQDQEQNDLAWGRRNLDSVGSDMLNKAYVIVTEESERLDQNEYTSQSTLLVWFECSGKVTFTSDLVYVCSKYNLKLHYKLLDYDLKKI